jgi:surface antigen
LYLPSTAGIVYTVKSGDTIDSIVEKYGSNSDEIIALNDLEVSGISEGTRIVIKDGSLPETERPEYVPPAPKPTYTNTYTYSYSYLGNTSERQNMRSEGYLYIGGGQCVDYALYKRPDLKALYGWSLGNANTWAMRATQSVVDRSPSAGAIFQTAAGYFGHVGYVEAVNGDGSIEVTEMNYGYIPYRVVRSTIPASAVGNFFYIH